MEGNQIEWEKLQNDACKMKENYKKSIVTLYVFFIVNAERNKNVSLTNTCEQLREQLDQAHSKVKCASHFQYDVIHYDFLLCGVCRCLHLKNNVLITRNALNSSKSRYRTRPFSVTKSARKKVQF